jgi:alginate O-acetyltransferase complex protein AlgJ
MRDVTPLTDGYLPDRPRPARFLRALVVLFVVAIAVPFVGTLHDRESTAEENRLAARWPRLALTRDGILGFPGRFERYFNDHFGWRGRLLALDHWAKAVLLHVSPVPNVLIGERGWLYFLGEDARSMERWRRGSQPFSDIEIATLRMELLHRRDYLADRGIAYVVIVAPEKYSVYPEYLPQWAAPLKNKTSLDRIDDEMARHPQLHFIDLRAALRAAKATDRLYYRTDSHWNYLGATVGYRVLMHELEQTFPDIPVTPVARPAYDAGVDVYSGDLAHMIGAAAHYREDDIAPLGKVLATPASRCAQRDAEFEGPLVEHYVYRCPDPRRYRALVFRDSMAIPLIPMLSENFAQSVYVSGRRFDVDLIERFGPDVVIEEMVERTLNAPAAYPMYGR